MWGNPALHPGSTRRAPMARMEMVTARRYAALISNSLFQESGCSSRREVWSILAASSDCEKINADGLARR